MNRYETLSVSDIQYLGFSGITRPCIKAISRLFQCGEKIEIAWLLTNKNTHAFILHNHIEELFVIKSGFSSGYNGTGPQGLAIALHILERHNVDIDEFEISFELIERLDKALLTQKDIEKLVTSKPVRPRRWDDYIFQQQHLGIQSKLNSYYPIELPFGIIDERIFDLALQFSENADSAVVSAYRRLEDIVRHRSGISESGAKLFSKAFVVENSPLYWDLPDEAESKGRGNLFSAVYTGFRNARAHRELSLSRQEELREFLLINELFLLESMSIDRQPKKNT